MMTFTPSKVCASLGDLSCECVSRSDTLPWFPRFHRDATGDAPGADGHEHQLLAGAEDLRHEPRHQCSADHDRRLANDGMRRQPPPCRMPGSSSTAKETRMRWCGRVGTTDRSTEVAQAAPRETRGPSPIAA
eukprot:scaffold652_cov260-Pinguiococcus_pyrenoidosus.AAC.5